MAGQLVMRGPNRWKVQVFVGRDADGKRRFFTKTIHGNKKAAEGFLNKVLLQKDEGQLLTASDSTSLSEYLADWLETAAKPKLKPRTLYEYERLLDRYVHKPIGHRPLSKLAPLDIQHVYTGLLDKGISGRTVRYLHAVLSSALKQAVKWKMLQHNPASLVELPRSQRQEMKALSAAEARRFLDAAGDTNGAVMLTVALTSGMRPGEYLALQWKDVDPKNGNLTVQRSLSRHKKTWSFQSPKTSRSRRTIPLPTTVMKRLAEHKVKQAEARLKRGEYIDHDLVFATASGLPYTIRNVLDDFFKPALKAAKLSEDIRLYDLRHTCATLLLVAGENPKVVSERLGHASVTLTLDTYSHVLPGMQESATKKLESVLFAN